jgi:hypothetical protein
MNASYASLGSNGGFTLKQQPLFMNSSMMGNGGNPALASLYQSHS